MYSLDYLFNRCDHKCTAWIIYSTDCITNVQLGLSTQEIFITNAQLRLSTPQIVPQIYTLDYLLNIFHHKCTAWIIYSTDLITNVHLRLSTPHILSQMYSLDYLFHRFIHTCTV